MKIVITGGASGIGLAISRRLLEEGHELVIGYRSSKESAQALAAEFANAHIFEADVANTQALDALFAYAGEVLGDMDALINNAGVSLVGCFQCIDDAQYENLMNINFGAVYKASARVLPFLLKKNSGNIINIASIWGVKGAATEALYSASKAAVIAFTQALAGELGPSGIRVNCIAPGVIDTKMNADLSDREMEALRLSTPLERIGTGEDIAGIVSFLLGKDASFITGQTIVADGGFLNG